MNQLLYGHLPPITKLSKIDELDMQDTAGEVGPKSCDLLLWTPSHGRAKAGRPAQTYIQQLCDDTGCSPEDLPKQWTIGRDGERESGISVLIA